MNQQDEKDLFEQLANNSRFRRWLGDKQDEWTLILKKASVENVPRAQGALAVLDDMIEKLTKK